MLPLKTQRWTCTLIGSRLRESADPPFHCWGGAECFGAWGALGAYNPAVCAAAAVPVRCRWGRWLQWSSKGPFEPSLQAFTEKKAMSTACLSLTTCYRYQMKKSPCNSKRRPPRLRLPLSPSVRFLQMNLQLVVESSTTLTDQDAQQLHPIIYVTVGKRNLNLRDDCNYTSRQNCLAYKAGIILI